MAPRAVTKAELAGRVAALEGERDRLADEVTAQSAAREELERRLGEVGGRLAATLAERDRLAADLADLSGRHAALAAEHAAVTRRQDRKRADAATPRIWVRWLRASPDGGARIGDVVYTARGHGEEMLVRVDHADLLAQSGQVEPRTAEASVWLDYWRMTHGGLVPRPTRMDAAARWMLDRHARQTPVPAGWPEELSYAELHPEPVELPPGLETRRVAAAEPLSAVTAPVDPAAPA